MSQNELIKKLAETIDVDYGDEIRKEELMSLFGIKQPDYDHVGNGRAFKVAMDEANWSFLSCMEHFKTYMREDRFMHLRSLGREGVYVIIRPDQHVGVALSHLDRAIKKGFKQCIEILESTQVGLLDQVDKVKLQTAQNKTKELERMFKTRTMREQLIDQEKKRQALF